MAQRVLWLLVGLFSLTQAAQVLESDAFFRWYNDFVKEAQGGRPKYNSGNKGNGNSGDGKQDSQTSTGPPPPPSVTADVTPSASLSQADDLRPRTTSAPPVTTTVPNEVPTATTIARTTTPPTSTSTELTPNCGAVVDGSVASSGVLTSPGYPDQYGNGLYCVWTIQGGKGKRVRLTFEDFEVTKTISCSGDYLLVSPTGLANDTSAVGMCGTDVPGEFLSERDAIFVEFRSTPDGDTCRGFSARYSVEEVVVSCGEEVSFLEFEFKNPEYPSAAKNETSHCELTISHDCDIHICQLRLDFEELELQPPEYGNCYNDQFMVRANEPTPTLCGSNSGQHMYVEVKGRASTSLHVLLSQIFPKPWGHVTNPDTGDTYPLEWRFEVEDNRRWKILVHQIPCDCSYDHLKSSSPRAPTGCLQYHDGVRETVRSFNFGGSKLDYDPCWNGTEVDCGRSVWTGHLNNLDYHVCVRVAEGYCGIMYTPTGPDAFLMTGQVWHGETGKRQNLYGSEGCQSDYVVVPKSRTPGDNDPWSHDRFCGLALGNYVKGPIVSYSTPFYVQVKTDADEFSSSVDLGNRGFELEYTQLPCSGPYLFNSDQKYSG